MSPSDPPDTSPRWKPIPLDRWDWLAGAVVLFGTFAVLMKTMDIGVTRDESFYFRAAREYIGWFEELWTNLAQGTWQESFTRANIDRHWSYNAEHPVLVKALFALSHKLFHEHLGWFSHIESLRLPGAAFGSLTCLLTYLFGRQTFGRTAGLIAVGALFLQPRFFFHAHMTCFDVPVVALWVAVVYAYWRSLDRGGWALVCGVLWGLALSAKLNAFFLPAVLGLHWLSTHWYRFGAPRVDDRRHLRLPPIPKAFFWMAALGPILFYALWPRHWFDTTERVLWYLNFHLKHVHYFVYYLGENWIRPPFPVAFPWVMTAITVPVTLFAAAAIGLLRACEEWRLGAWWARWRDAIKHRALPQESPWDHRGTAWLFLLNAVFPIALIGMPDTPIFGGTKHWMPAMPFLAVIAGAGVVAAATSLASLVSAERRALVLAAATLVASAAVLGPAAWATSQTYRWGTGYYNELIGGPRGAADAGMMRQFWGYAGYDGLAFLNEYAPDGTRVWISNTTTGAWRAYRREGLIEARVRPVGIEASDVALFHHQQAFAKQLNKVYESYGTMTPSRIYGPDGVPMLSIYLRPGSAIHRAVHGQPAPPSDNLAPGAAPRVIPPTLNLRPHKTLAPARTSDDPR